MQELKLLVPTYNASLFSAEVARNERAEFGDPFVAMLVHEAEGVRIVLGTHDYGDTEKPDVQIERQPNGWAIFLQPLGGSDSSAVVYFHDDGRSYLLKERAGGPTPPIAIVEPGTPVPAFDVPE